MRMPLALTSLLPPAPIPPVSRLLLFYPPAGFLPRSPYQMIGFLRPTSGTAIIEGMDILEDINSIYSVMGVCPQHE